MTAPIEKLDREQLLNRFQAKARCYHTYRLGTRHPPLADQLWWRLRKHLTEEQIGAMMSAISHARMQEGPRELDEVCAGIRESWK